MGSLCYPCFIWGVSYPSLYPPLFLTNLYFWPYFPYSFLTPWLSSFHLSLLNCDLLTFMLSLTYYYPLSHLAPLLQLLLCFSHNSSSSSPFSSRFFFSVSIHLFTSIHHSTFCMELFHLYSWLSPQYINLSLLTYDLLNVLWLPISVFHIVMLFYKYASQ